MDYKQIGSAFLGLHNALKEIENCEKFISDLKSSGGVGGGLLKVFFDTNPLCEIEMHHAFGDRDKIKEKLIEITEMNIMNATDLVRMYKKDIAEYIGVDIFKIK